MIGKYLIEIIRISRNRQNLKFWVSATTHTRNSLGKYAQHRTRIRDISVYISNILIHKYSYTYTTGRNAYNTICIYKETLSPQLHKIAALYAFGRFGGPSPTLEEELESEPPSDPNSPPGASSATAGKHHPHRECTSLSPGSLAPQTSKSR